MDSFHCPILITVVPTDWNFLVFQIFCMQVNRPAFFDRDIFTKVCSVCYLSHNKFAFEAKLSLAKLNDQRHHNSSQQYWLLCVFWTLPPCECTQ